MDKLLEIKDLHVNFQLNEGIVKAVKGVSFDIPKGGTVALVGESGSGKSVISQAIMGILPKAASITSGEILFHDPTLKTDHKIIDIARLSSNSPTMQNIRGGKISIIFQEPMTSLSPLHTIGDQITEAVLLHRPVTLSEAQELSYEMLNAVGFPEPRQALNRYPFELSGGLRQRAMIAMSLVCRPALLIADEPTTALDVTIQAQILKIIKDLQQELGMAVLMITHDLGVVANIARDVVVMYHGEVMEQGKLHEIYHNPQHPYLKALLAAVPRFDMPMGERLKPIREIIPKTGHLFAEKISESDPKSSKNEETILKVKEIYKSFTAKKTSFFAAKKTQNKIYAVNNVSFEVKRGTCLGLVGESGCGKTTLSKILMRALKADSGQVIYNDGQKDIDLGQLNDQDLINFRTKMQFIFQDPFSSLNPRMTIEDILTEPLIIHNIGTKASRREMAMELMELVGLDQRHLKRFPHSFSGGQRQRIGIARALALRPELIICDEPVSALDVSIQAQILNLLKDLQEKLGLTYIFISHNLAVVDYIADDIAVMCRGRIVEVAPKKSLFKNPIHPYTKRLLKAVPEPNLDRLLDFDHLMNEKANNPETWPKPFTDNGQYKLTLNDMTQGHFVRTHVGSQIEGQ